MRFAGMPGETHRDHGHSRHSGILLPFCQRHRCQQIVVADDRIGLMRGGQSRGFADAHTWNRVDTKRLEEPAEVLAQERMSTDAQHFHGLNIPLGRRDVQRFDWDGARDVCHAAQQRVESRGTDRALQVA